MKQYEGPVSGGPLNHQILAHDSRRKTLRRFNGGQNHTDVEVATDFGTYEYIQKGTKGYWMWLGWDSERRGVM